MPNHCRYFCSAIPRDSQRALLLSHGNRSKGKREPFSSASAFLGELCGGGEIAGDVPDSLLQQTLKLVELKGWGRLVWHVVQSWVAKHTHIVKQMQWKSWGNDEGTTSPQPNNLCPDRDGDWRQLAGSRPAGGERGSHGHIPRQ